MSFQYESKNYYDIKSYYKTISLATKQSLIIQLRQKRVKNNQEVEINHKDNPRIKKKLNLNNRYFLIRKLMQTENLLVCVQYV